MSGLPATEGGATASAATAGDSSWTVYHQAPAGTGVDTSAAAVDHLEPGMVVAHTRRSDLWGAAGFWRTGLRGDGERHGVCAGLGDRRHRLVMHLGTPVPSGSLPCGDISPTVGITGTPVVDPTRSEIFVVADELQNGNPAHVLVGLDTAFGSHRDDPERGPEPAPNRPRSSSEPG